VLAAEKSLYDFSWLDKDKEIYVLQNRRFRKDGQIYIGATGNYIVSGAFINGFGGTARGGYFFREDWGIELVYGKSMGSENDAARAVLQQATVPFYRKVDSYMGGMLMWSPFYSKINTFNRIFYFDWMFGLGGASINTRDNRQRFVNQDNKSLTSDSASGLLWNTGFRFYISDSWSLRLDVTSLHWRAKATRRGVGAGQTTEVSKYFSHTDVGLGLNYAF
jgi:outer membrane beta-barrel protein